MVAPQILVLIVGVRILLGELKLTISQLFFSSLKDFGRFEYRFSSPPSQGGETGSTPVVAIWKVSASVETFLFYMQIFLGK